MSYGFFTYEAEPGELVDIRWKRCRKAILISLIPLALLSGVAVALWCVCGNIAASVMLEAAFLVAWGKAAFRYIPDKTGFSSAVRGLSDEVESLTLY